LKCEEKISNSFIQNLANFFRKMRILWQNIPFSFIYIFILAKFCTKKQRWSGLLLWETWLKGLLLIRMRAKNTDLMISWKEGNHYTITICKKENSVPKSKAKYVNERKMELELNFVHNSSPIIKILTLRVTRNPFLNPPCSLDANRAMPWIHTKHVLQKLAWRLAEDWPHT
jgi:hypothetical protein